MTNDSGSAAKFAVSVSTTFHSTFEEDVANYSDAGIAGIGLWEYKLEGIDDSEGATRLAEKGLTATYCFPLTPGIFTGNGHFAQPKDPDERLKLLCASIPKFAAYQPEAVCILAGAPQEDGEAASWARVVKAFKQASKVAADSGVQLALEVISPGTAGSLVQSIPRALDMISDVGADNIGILLDSWHIVDEPLENIAKYIEHIVGIQVCDQKADYKGRFDRAMPGEGILPVEETIRIAHGAGYNGWYELEIFSDDGTFGEPVENSMWQQPPLQVLRAGKSAFQQVYDRAVAAH